MGESEDTEVRARRAALNDLTNLIAERVSSYVDVRRSALRSGDFIDITELYLHESKSLLDLRLLHVQEYACGYEKVGRVRDNRVRWTCFVRAQLSDDDLDQIARHVRDAVTRRVEKIEALLASGRAAIQKGDFAEAIRALSLAYVTASASPLPQTQDGLMTAGFDLVKALQGTNLSLRTQVFDSCNYQIVVMARGSLGQPMGGVPLWTELRAGDTRFQEYTSVTRADGTALISLAPPTPSPFEIYTRLDTGNLMLGLRPSTVTEEPEIDGPGARMTSPAMSLLLDPESLYRPFRVDVTLTPVWQREGLWPFRSWELRDLTGRLVVSGASSLVVDLRLVILGVEVGQELFDTGGDIREVARLTVSPRTLTITRIPMREQVPRILAALKSSKAASTSPIRIRLLLGLESECGLITKTTEILVSIRPPAG